MEDTKTTDLIALAALADVDIWAVVDNPGGTDLNRKITALKTSTYIGTKNLSNLANAGTSRTNLGVAIGTDVQEEISGATLTSATVATGDKILGQDLDDSDNLKTYTAQSIADLKVTELSEDTSPLLGGALDAAGNNITDVHELRIDAIPDTDHTANGLTTNTISAGVTTAVGDLLYLASDGEWALTDADAAATATGMLAVSMAVGSDGNPLLVALAGSFVRDDTFAFTVGAELFISTTAGDLTETAPSATGDIVRVVGYAVSADVVYFNPGSTWVEIA